MSDMLQVKSTPVIKLKDRPNRGGVRFNLLTDFGFVPDEIIIQKVAGSNNSFIVSAVLTKEELKKEEDRVAALPPPMKDPKVKK